MSEVAVWLDEAKTELQRWDHQGNMPEPMPLYSDIELLGVIKDFWGESHTVGYTYAWLIASEQPVNPFEIKKVFDQMDRDLADHQARVEAYRDLD
jgi:hypothetical protein